MRFQAEIAKKDSIVLQQLMSQLEIPSNAELISHLIYIANWAITERNHGRKIASIGSHGEPLRELVSPLLERAAPEHDLPSIQIEWTKEELKGLSKLATKIPAQPTAKLRRLMRDS